MTKLIVFFLLTFSYMSSCYSMCEQLVMPQIDISHINTREYIENILLTEESILEFTRHLNPIVADREDEGANNLGVFSVSSMITSQNVAFKVIKANVFDYDIQGHNSKFRPDKLINGLNPGENAYGFHQYVLVHHLLGELALAPKILGVMTQKQLVELYDNEDSEYSYTISMGDKTKIEEYRKELKKKPGHVGVLMEQVNRDWQLSRRRGVTDQFKDWSEDDIINGFKQMEYIRNILTEYRIFAGDMQLVANNEKKILLIDLDGFRFYEKNETLLPYGFRQEYERLIYAWETANEKKLSTHIREEWDDKFPSYEGHETSTMAAGMLRSGGL